MQDKRLWTFFPKPFHFGISFSTNFNTLRVNPGLKLLLIGGRIHGMQDSLSVIIDFLISITTLILRLSTCNFQTFQPATYPPCQTSNLLLLTFNFHPCPPTKLQSTTKTLHLVSGYNTQMDFYLPQANADPNPSNRTTPEETRITQLSAQPYPDGYRLRVNMEITPFQKRPYIEVTLSDAEGEEVASTNIVEPLGWKLEFTMHIRGELHNPYILSARLYYPEGPENEPVTYSFDVEPPPAIADPSTSAQGDSN